MESNITNYTDFMNKKIKVYFRTHNNEIFCYTGILIGVDDYSVMIDDRILGRTLISLNEITQVKEWKGESDGTQISG